MLRFLGNRCGMKIISYFGNLYLHHFKDDVIEIKERGFDTIIFCVTHTDLLYSLDNIKEMKEYAESEGLKTVAGPWGLAGIFGGEAISLVNAKRDGMAATKALVFEWINTMEETGFKNIFLDEPHLGSHSENLQFIKKMVDVFRLYELQFILCLSDDRFDAMTDEEIKELPVNVFGVSNYFWHGRWPEIEQKSIERIERLTRLRPDNLIFIQGFDLPANRNLLPFLIQNICKEKQVKHIGFWGFRCAEATSSKRAIDHKIIWELI